ncbi:MAG: ribonuclease P protein component [Candidatus Magasanikbacteria bacterium]|nr:ribonuclease P protein component [Candidatus Magasanikbacteria bacterium]|tara:strand:+ start:3103 stop:3480 length:378 start_codon:yes stop_codon:yes gene_type:complete
MLPKENRLKKKRNFDITYTDGRFFAGKYIHIKVWKIDEHRYPKRDFKNTDLKIGIVVGKKVHKSAVKRNRIKRQIREVFRLLLKEVGIKKGYTIICIAKALPDEFDYAILEKDVKNVLKKARVMV